MMNRKQGTYEVYLAIPYEANAALVAVDPSKPDKLCWFGSPGFYYDANPNILKTYYARNFRDEQGQVQEEEIARQFVKDFPPKAGWPTPNCFGWISSDGLFYPCRYGQHGRMGGDMALAFYDSPDIEELGVRGWIKLDASGEAWNGDDDECRPITPAQELTLRAIRDISTRDYRKNLDEFLHMVGGL